MFGQLGDIVFDGPLGPSSLSIQGDETYAEQPLINTRPKLDHTGTGLRTISMGIQFHFSFCTPEAQVNALWQHKQNADILSFILGNGRVIGNFVITSLTETPAQTDPIGNYVCVQMQVSLKEVWTQDVSTQQQQTAQKKAIAFAENGPTPVVIRSKEWKTALWAAQEQIMEARTIVAAISNVIKYASVPDFWLLAGSQLGAYLAIGIGSITDLIEDGIDPEIIALCPALLGEAIGCLSELTAMQAALPIVSFAVLTTQMTALQTAFDAMQDAALQLMLNVIFRM